MHLEPNFIYFEKISTPYFLKYGLHVTIVRAREPSSDELLLKVFIDTDIDNSRYRHTRYKHKFYISIHVAIPKVSLPPKRPSL